ncbi:A disintegrin and metallo ase with thrombospondin motifs 13 [Labeo rohita]|uniref:A disintegrin and metallo ase with thrombospondin motifs 13 n=1 Tax=Labeo rohita TaxID=84645 RepID=A0A498MGF1_LABRO|nr:A disintegrin and metallo ase with thrombospondin motifs 13 [Labeo rohita]
MHFAEGQFRLRRTPLGSEVTHLELAVVVGPDVYDFHRQDTERYILTNLNIASELLRDVTLGANIRVHLVRMVILTEPKPDIQISENITSSLKSVCEWGQKVNPDADTDPLHADLLLYITRFDLVLPNGNKLVRGVTQLGGVCSSQWNCVITEDTGFDLGITIAHEIGHSSGKAECVKDMPVLGGSVQDWRPGLFYGVDDQCRIAFGSSATACSFTNGDMATCRVLSCHINPHDRSSCTRLLVPLLDGTECGPSQWCLKGRCVSPSTLGSSVMVHGSWSSWSEFSPCSRTCGGGITYRKRQCNNPRPAFGGNVCKGQDTEAELCNQQPCESTQLEFMSQQCSATDQQPLSVSPDSGSVYTWIPAVGYSSGDAQCKLMCRSREQDFMVSRGSQFIEGTRCEAGHTIPRGAISACLGGKCQLFGCDGVMHSGKVEDVCGVCGGNGSTCQFISSTYSGGEAGEYVTFLNLPLNASQVHVINTKPVFTHLAVLLNDKYVVSGDGNPGLSIKYPSPLEKSPIIYNLYLTPDHLPQTEELTISGPVTDKIHIQVFRKYGQEYGDLTTPNISYQYYSSEAVSVKRAAEGRWSTVISACSVTCGTGIQKISQHCVDVLTSDRLEDELCSSSPQTADQLQPCFQPDCPPSWEVGEFGACSAPCGVGERVRSVTCVQKQGTVKVIHTGLHVMPRSRMVSVYVWSPVIGQCSKTCGNGSQQVWFSCVDHQSHLEVPEFLCDRTSKPEMYTQPCSLSICPVTWRYIQGPCSVSCGGGVAKRVLYCSQRMEGGDGNRDLVVGESACQSVARPAEVVECNTEACPARWQAGELGDCSVSCGMGVAVRSVQCVQYEGGIERVVEEDSVQSHVVMGSSLGLCPAWARPALFLSVPFFASTYQNPSPSRPAIVLTVPQLRPPHQSPRALTSSICGQLLLQDSGTIDLRNVTQMRCIFAIGRPLDEVIQIKIISSTLKCQQKENIALYDRRILMRLCERMTGKTLKSRSNVLLVRQSRLTPGNGMLLFYQSMKNKKSHHGECDVQLFSPSGVIENPIKSAAASNTQNCRVFIDAPPAFRIQIRALSVLNNTDTNFTYILIRDVDALKTTIFRGSQLFLWSSSGNRAEVEFHGEYQQIKGIFRAEYSYINPSEEQPV